MLYQVSSRRHYPMIVEAESEEAAVQKYEQARGLVSGLNPIEVKLADAVVPDGSPFGMSRGDRVEAYEARGPVGSGLDGGASE